MKILVACEESQAVTKELRRLGNEAYSCDIIECSGGKPEWHIKGDALKVAYDLFNEWDMMIAFPPCTHLAVSGARWFPAKIADGRQQQGIDLFMGLMNAPIPKIALENPVGIMSTKFRKPNQIIQPWMFGDNAKKTTCLWTKGLDNLIPDITTEPELEYHNMPGGKRMEMWMYKIRCTTVKNGARAKLASKTFPGIAKAMAEQWSKNEMKHIVCFSGGHSSAVVAIEVVRKYGKENVILLNHNLKGGEDGVEDDDIQRFKEEVALYLDINITYANNNDWESKDQLDICIDAKAFKTSHTSVICTSRLKTQPFKRYLDDLDFEKENIVIYYGFDKQEDNRINRRTKILEEMGYKTDYPLANWENRTIYETKEIGIRRPLTYNSFKHANCKGCIKGGSQHWYVVFCNRRDIWDKAKLAEDKIGYSIIKNNYLKDLECKFKLMESLGIEPTEHIQHQTFWANVRKKIRDTKLEEIAGYEKSCMCT